VNWSGKNGCVCVCVHTHTPTHARTYIIHTYIYNKQKKCSYKITRIQHSLSIIVISSNVANTPLTKSNLCYITLLQNKDRHSVKVIHMSHTQFNQFSNDQSNVVNLHVCVSTTYRQKAILHQLQNNTQFEKCI